MSNLPPKPDFQPEGTDRHYSRPPPRERVYPDSYVPRSSRPQAIADSYVATDSYVAPSYERRHDRSYDYPPRHNWDHDSRSGSGWRDRNDRRDLPTRHREEADWRTREEPGERRRNLDSRREYPSSRGPPRDSRDYSRDHHRNREYDPRSRDDDRRYRRESSPSDRRWTSRSSISPSRRPDSESRRRSPLPQKRSASPPLRRSRPPRSPPHVEVSNQHASSAVRDRDTLRIRRSPSVTENERRSYKAARRGGSPQPSNKLRSPSPEPPEDVLPENSLKTKGKARAIADDSLDDSTKQSSPEHHDPIAAPSSLQTVETPKSKNYRRSPPTAPREHNKPQTSNSNSHASQFQTSTSFSDWKQSESSTSVIAMTEDHTVVSEQPVIRLPEIPVYTPQLSLTPKLDAEINELLKVNRVRMKAEYEEISKATRRAVHELEIANVDLNAARMRREIADAQMEMARAGRLGLEYEGVFG